MTTLNDFIEEQLQDPVFKEKYDALEPEFTVMQAMIDARKGNDTERIGRGNGNISS